LKAWAYLPAAGLDRFLPLTSHQVHALLERIATGVDET
jgi:hypothetical protein